MWALINTLIDTGTTLFTGWLNRKKAEQEAKLEVAKDKVRAEAAWDQTQAAASETSWKDEYWTIVLSVPAIFCFIPSLVDDVKAGFAVLETMPEWYRAALLTAIAAAFGVRTLARFVPRKDKKKKEAGTN